MSIAFLSNQALLEQYHRLSITLQPNTKEQASEQWNIVAELHHRGLLCKINCNLKHLKPLTILIFLIWQKEGYEQKIPVNYTDSPNILQAYFCGNYHGIPREHFDNFFGEEGFQVLQPMITCNEHFLIEYPYLDERYQKDHSLAAPLSMVSPGSYLHHILAEIPPESYSLYEKTLLGFYFREQCLMQELAHTYNP